MFLGPAASPISQFALLGFLVGALAALLVSPNAVAGAPSDDWPGFRGPNGNGQLQSGLPTGEEGELQLRVGWKKTLGSGYSGIAVGGGIAVTATSNAKRDQVMAFDPASGAERWRADLGALTVGVGGSKDGPISTPAIRDGRVFMVSTQGNLVALDLRSGEALWSVHLVEDLGSARPIYGFSTSPAVAGDVVVVQAGGSKGSLVGIEASTGAVRWRSFLDRHYAPVSDRDRTCRPNSGRGHGLGEGRGYRSHGRDRAVESRARRCRRARCRVVVADAGGW